MIKVLLVDDSPVALTILKRMLSKSPEIEVVGTAENGRDALRLIPQVRPDVVCTDLHMPVMDGLEFTKEVMAKHPLPILLVSVSGRQDSLNAFKVLEAGAIDLFLKPKAGFDLNFERLTPELIMKIRILSGIHVFSRPKPVSVSVGRISGAKGIGSKIHIPEPKIRIIVIGASTGGPQALQTILTNLPSYFPLPIICIQHISEGFLQGLIDWLSSLCKMKVEIAQAGAIPQAGTIYFPQEETHLKIDGAGRFVLSPAPPFDGHRPSVTVTMRDIAGYYGNSTFGVLLTGMGKDGAEGLLAIKKAGGITIAQDETSSIVFGMPKQAIELDAAGYIAPLDEIGPMILNFVL
ncbi:MAG: chemotaxis-specific protein-glutamate methyltransferase CheB [Deltaproteobacteria bacterium]|nr:chemotaxis-specific protein-glutamate methyltransferase CheB [Deltaproteobacteria bacterium]